MLPFLAAAPMDESPVQKPNIDFEVAIPSFEPPSLSVTNRGPLLSVYIPPTSGWYDIAHPENKNATNVVAFYRLIKSSLTSLPLNYKKHNMFVNEKLFRKGSKFSISSNNITILVQCKGFNYLF